jgi:WD40 repeat protein
VRKLRFSDQVWWVAVSPDGERIAVQTQSQGATNSTVEVRDVDSGNVLFSHDLPNGSGEEFYRGGVSFSPDGKHVAALGCCQPGTTIQVWDARSGEELFRPEVENATSFAFSSDGRLLGATTADGKVFLIDAHDGRRVGPPIDASGDVISQISFSPDSRLFAVSSNDLTATLWDIQTRKRIGNTFPTEPGVVPSAQFAANGDLIIDYLAKATVWPTDLQAWVRYACQVAGRDLTAVEWIDLLPGRPYQHVCPQ